MTLRSCLRWKSTGRIFKTVGLRWVPTGRILTSNIIKVDNEPPDGSNEDITNQYECAQTLDVSAGFKEFSTDEQAMTSDHNNSELRLHDHSNEQSSSKLVPNVVYLADNTDTPRQELKLLFYHHMKMLRMLTKIELTLEQSQQGVSNDFLDNVEMEHTMDVDNEDVKYCLDDMSIGFEEDTSHGEIKNKKVNLDQCIADVMDTKTMTVAIESHSFELYQIKNVSEENLVKVNDTPSLKTSFRVVGSKRKPDLALQSSYEQQQSTTPPPEKGEQLQVNF
nr:hypothetical protein [Tanacetum cinerariifolium]